MEIRIIEELREKLTEVERRTLEKIKDTPIEELLGTESKVIILNLELPKLVWMVVEGFAESEKFDIPTLFATMLAKRLCLPPKLRGLL